MASVEVLAGPKQQRWGSVEQKQTIVAAAFGPGAVVRDVARQADVTQSLIYRWRRDLRAAAGAGSLSPLPSCASVPHRKFALLSALFVLKFFDFLVFG